jgi:hypothetical protein
MGALFVHLRGSPFSTSLIIEGLLFEFALLAAVVFSASLGGTSLTMGLPTAKGTPQVPSTGISGVGKKKYPTMPAPGQAFS